MRLGPYEILALLGAGGMGSVYRARDCRLDRDVAIKVVRPDLLADQTARGRFRAEALALARFNHPHVAVIHDVGEQGGIDYLVMECVPGQPLSARLGTGPMPVRDIVALGSQIAAALEEAHERGVVHRDLKPANVIVTPKGQAKVLDFGLAKLLRPISDSTSTQTLGDTGSMAGTLSYMSPEQVRGEPLDGRTDVFSFGVMLYEMATGVRPFRGETPGVVAEAILNLTQAPPSSLNRALSPKLEAIIDRALQKDRNLRYQHAADLRADLQRLERALDSSGAGAQTDHAGTGKPRSSSGVRTAVAAAGILLAVGLPLGGWLLGSRPVHGLTETDTIVLAEFANSSGDPVFDGTLRQGLAVQLEQSPFLRLVSDDRIDRTLRLMGRPADLRLSPQVAREICERVEGAAVLAGSMASLGSQYVIGLRAENCRTGDVLFDEQAQAARKEDVLKVLSRLASRFRSRAGESLATVNAHSTPLEEATTSSLEALRAYGTGLKVSFLSGSADAVPFLQRAVEIDPEFATAYAALGLMYSNIGESVLAMENTRKAYELRQRASDRERFFITTLFDRQVTGNLEKEQQTLRLWAKTYPRDRDAHGLLSGFASQGSGRYEQSIEAARRAIAIDPDFLPGYVNLAFGFTFLDRIGEAEESIRRAAERRIEVPELAMLKYYLGFIEGDAARMAHEVELARGKPPAEDWLAHSQALVLARSGRLREAERLWRRAIESALQSGQRERAAIYEAGDGVSNALVGNLAAARRSALAALDLSKGRDVEYGAAVALALAGDSTRAEIIANDLGRRFPEDTSVRFTYLPSLRALFALDRRDPALALEALQTALPYDLAVPGIDFVGCFGGLYSAYIRGQAYLGTRQGAAAAAELERVIAHRGIVLGDPVGALSHLQLGRALVLSGDRVKARAAYQDFLTIWKDADPELAVLKQAKAEYARLH